MTCLRCQGLMLEDHFFDFEGAYGFMWMKGWRCMNCGYVHEGPEAPQTCPACKHPQSFYEVLAENW